MVRFFQKIQVLGEADCWLWTGAKTVSGYGYFVRNESGQRFSARAHRLAYELLVGPVPEELVIDHLCRNKSCVNPAHLEVVTQRENIMRGEAPSAVNARKTHCLNGHLLSDVNVYVSPRGDRTCRACRREAARRNYEARASA